MPDVTLILTDPGALIAWTTVRADVLEGADDAAPLRQHETCGGAGPPARPTSAAVSRASG